MPRAGRLREGAASRNLQCVCSLPPHNELHMKTTLLAALVPIALLAACSGKEPPPDAAPPVTPTVETPAVAATPAPATAATQPPPVVATVTLESKSGSTAKGDLKLTLTGNAVQITGAVTGLTAGAEHGFHVHETGDCAAPDAESAGPHFNPTQLQHGSPTTAPHHLGDLANIKADAAGQATLNATLEGATLRDDGTSDLVGKALIVHAKKDDYVTQPSGNSGARIACGVIR
jgi:Cu-Zn family superoxide dismutase